MFILTACFKYVLFFRYDLNPVDGNYDGYGCLSMHILTGSIDAKVTNADYAKNLKFVAVSGPTKGKDNSLPVFKWSEVNEKDSETPHRGLPDKFDFPDVTTNWKINLDAGNLDDAIPI